MTTDAPVYVDYRPRGGSLAMFRFVRDKLRVGGQYEILHDGPAGTGKSRVNMELILWLCEEYPGTRVLMGRKTRASMTETTLATWENLVLPAGHPTRQGPTRAGRRGYKFPNGSEVIVMGFDDPERVKSLEVDLAYINEANELSLNDHEILITRLRGGRLPAKFVLCDCNPDVPRHWLMNRVRSGVMERFIGRHKDNPRYWDGADWTKEGTDYVMGTLHNLTGVRRRRLLDGEWCAAEGQIYEMFDSAIHQIDARECPGYNPHPDPSKGDKTWNFDWTLMTIDWGTRAPGVLQGWGITDGRAYRFFEQYRVGGEMRRVNYGLDAATTEQKVDHDFPIHAWWADRASELAKEIQPHAIVCDTDRPKAMRLLNERLSEGMGRTPVVARPVEKKAMGKKGFLLDGIDLVRERLLPSPIDGRPSIYLVRGALVSPDPELVAQEKPTCTEDEIPEYVWAQSLDGRPIREEPDPTCADHGCAAMRYMACFVWGKDYKPVPVEDDGEVTLLSPVERIFKWDFLEED